MTVIQRSCHPGGSLRRYLCIFLKWKPFSETTTQLCCSTGPPGHQALKFIGKASSNGISTASVYSYYLLPHFCTCQCLWMILWIIIKGNFEYLGMKKWTNNFIDSQRQVILILCSIICFHSTAFVTPLCLFTFVVLSFNNLWERFCQ